MDLLADNPAILLLKRRPDNPVLTNIYIDWHAIHFFFNIVF